MEGLENAISQILGDPGSMAQIMSLAQSLGLSEPSAEPPPEQKAAPTDDSMRSMMELLKQTGTAPREAKLLEALKPYFSDERQQRIDRALRAARMAQLATTALRTMNRKE